MAAASFRWILQLHKDVSKAARFYTSTRKAWISPSMSALSDGSSFILAHSNSPSCDPPTMRLMKVLHSDHVMQKGYSLLVSFTVPDINETVTKLMTLGAELDGPIKYENHGKVAAMRYIDEHMLGLYEPL